jgi:uncharacterized protein (DUF1697 family)
VSAPRTGSDAWLILLRGINVGGRRVIAMGDLRTAFADMGFDDPVTYIQSGNIVVGSRRPRTARSAATIERRLEEQFGYDARVVIRDASEMARIVRGIPEDWDVGDAGTRHNVIFLTDGVRAKGLIDPATLRAEFEALVVGDGVLYWSAPAPTITRTAMVKLSAHPSYAQMTVRNLRTTLRLGEMMRDRADRHRVGGAANRRVL